MSEIQKNLHVFLKFLADNKELNAKAQEFGKNNDIDGFVRYAKELGYEFSKDDVLEYQNKLLQMFKAKTQKAVKAEFPERQKGLEELRKFIMLSETDKTLATHLEKVGFDNLEAIIACGKENGFEFNEEDMRLFAKEIIEQSDELSDEELAVAAGGFVSVGLAVGAGLLFAAAGAGLVVGAASVATTVAAVVVAVTVLFNSAAK